MFALQFDAFKRKLAANADFPFKLVPEATCTKGTPDWDTWFARFNLDDTDLHVSIEDDASTYTFFRIVPKSDPDPVVEPENRTKSDNEHGH